MSNLKTELRDLPKPVRTALGVGAVVDSALRAYALVDLAKRDQQQVKGPKAAWAASLSLVNSLGVLPAVYLVWGRKR